MESNLEFELTDTNRNFRNGKLPPILELEEQTRFVLKHAAEAHRQYLGVYRSLKKPERSDWHRIW